MKTFAIVLLIFAARVQSAPATLAALQQRYAALPSVQLEGRVMRYGSTGSASSWQLNFDRALGFRSMRTEQTFGNIDPLAGSGTLVYEFCGNFDNAQQARYEISEFGKGVQRPPLQPSKPIFEQALKQLDLGTVLSEQPEYFLLGLLNDSSAITYACKASPANSTSVLQCSDPKDATRTTKLWLDPANGLLQKAAFKLNGMVTTLEITVQKTPQKFAAAQLRWQIPEGAHEGVAYPEFDAKMLALARSKSRKGLIAFLISTMQMRIPGDSQSEFARLLEYASDAKIPQARTYWARTLLDSEKMKTQLPDRWATRTPHERATESRRLLFEATLACEHGALDTLKERCQNELACSADPEQVKEIKSLINETSCQRQKVPAIVRDKTPPTWAVW
jgi:hypothetical protein